MVVVADVAFSAVSVDSLYAMVINNMISMNQTKNRSSWKSSFYSTEKLVMKFLQNVKEKTFDGLHF